MYRQGNQKDFDAFATVSAHDIWALGRYILPAALPVYIIVLMVQPGS
jgi:hypothetical protein